MKKILFPLATEFDMKLPYFFSGIGCQYEQEDIIRPNGYPAYQWIQCRNGSGELELNGTTHIIKEGQGMFFFPNEPHAYHASGSKWSVDWIIFCGSCIDSFVHDTLNMRTSGIYYISSPSVIAGKLEGLYTEASSKHMNSITCSSIVYSVLMDILSHTSETQNTSMTDKYNRLTPVIDYIQNNSDKELPLDTLADIAGLTPQYLCSAFKRSTSQTLTEYINIVRIRKSKDLLLYDVNMQIKEIAHIIGFNDVSYFCSVFKRIEHITPTEFRRLHN